MAWKTFMKTSPRVSNAIWFSNSWWKKELTAHIWISDMDIFLMHVLWPDISADGHQKTEKGNEKVLAEGKKIIYYLPKLLFKIFWQCMCSRNSTLSLLKNIFVTYFSQDCKLALLQHFLGIFITICRATSGFVNWTAVIHHMNPKCEQHAKENHTKIKLNYTWHLIFQKKTLFVGIFIVGFFPSSLLNQSK